MSVDIPFIWAILTVAFPLQDAWVEPSSKVPAELLYVIAEGAFPTDLPSLVQTCREFHLSASPVLWRELPSPLPLFRLVSNFTVVDGVWVSVKSCTRVNSLRFFFLPHIL